MQDNIWEAVVNNDSPSIKNKQKKTEKYIQYYAYMHNMCMRGFHMRTEISILKHEY